MLLKALGATLGPSWALLGGLERVPKRSSEDVDVKMSLKRGKLMFFHVPAGKQAARCCRQGGLLQLTK